MNIATRITRNHKDKAPRHPLGRRRSNGFSLIELIVVLAISVILAAIAVPEVLNTYYSSRVRDAANQFSALVQQGVILAEQKNVTLPLYTGAVQNSASGAFVACSSSSCPTGGNGTSYQTGDSAVSYGANVTNGSSSSAPSGLNPGITPESSSTTLYFSPRGDAVKSNGISYTLSKGFVFYFTDTRNDWAAVAVSSLGRSKVYVWNGSSWN